MCNTHQLVVSDYGAYGRDSGQFAYVCDAHITTSWLDHVLCREDVLSINVNLQYFVSASSVYSSSRDKVIFNWAKASIDDINEYCVNTYTKFAAIDIVPAMKCTNVNCMSIEHRRQIDL